MDYKTKLKNCRSCAEAKPIMEAMHMGPASQQLMDYYYQLRVSKDPRQQAHGENAFATAIREAEENDHKTQEDNGGAHRKPNGGGEADIAGIIKDKAQEADEITGPLDSHQSSDIDRPYPKEGDDEQNSAIESMQGGGASGTSQMSGISDGLKENIPGMMPQPGMPPMAPEVQQSMAPQMPKMPPMSTPQVMRQMQYTVEQNNKVLYSRIINPLVREVKKLREANIALDKKIQETQSNAGSMKLDLEKVKENSPVRDHRIQETIPGTGIEIPQQRFVNAELENKRFEIARLDKELSKAQPYQ